MRPKKPRITPSDDVTFCFLLNLSGPEIDGYGFRISAADYDTARKSHWVSSKNTYFELHFSFFLLLLLLSFYLQHPFDF